MTLPITETSINGIGDQSVNEGLRIYPNPATDYIVVDLPAGISSQASITVIDVLGKVVSNQTIDSGASMDVSSLSNGAYLLRINYDGKSITRKIFIKK